MIVGRQIERPCATPRNGTRSSLQGEHPRCSDREKQLTMLIRNCRVRIVGLAGIG
jgi:hypothetical protein